MVSRSISSHVPSPTSPIHISFVPGRKVQRNGLRKPSAMMRCALALLFPANGLSGIPRPVSGFTRIIEPFSATGSPGARRIDCARSEPPSALGSCSTPPVVPGSLHGFPVWP